MGHLADTMKKTVESLDALAEGEQGNVTEQAKETVKEEPATQPENGKNPDKEENVNKLMEFDIRMTAKALNDYFLYHCYTGFSGIFSIVLGIGIIGYAIYGLCIGAVPQSLLYLLFGAFFLVYTPVNLNTRAKRQMMVSDMFKNPLHYTITEKGIVVQQNKTSAEVEWSDLYKVVSTKRSLIVYAGKRNAFIWIKEDLGEQYEAVVSCLREHIDEKKLRIR